MKKLFRKHKKYIHAIVYGKYALGRDFKEPKTLLLIRNLYQAFIVILVAYSIITLAVPIRKRLLFESFFIIIDLVIFFSFLGDYILRWLTCNVDNKNIDDKRSFILFPFSFMGIILFSSLLPSLNVLIYFDKNLNFFGTGHKEVWGYLAQLKFLRILRILLIAHMFSPLRFFLNSLKRNEKLFQLIFIIIILTILTSAIALYNTEYVSIIDAGGKPVKENKITSFFDALYSATITLTTIGFGDYVPHTSKGKVIVMILSVIGVAIVSIPSGIIAGGFISEVQEAREKTREARERKKDRKNKIVIQKIDNLEQEIIKEHKATKKVKKEVKEIKENTETKIIKNLKPAKKTVKKPLKKTTKKSVKK